MRPLHYAVLAVVLASGLFGLNLLVPSQAELGLMYSKDNRLDAARAIYEARLAAGDRSADVLGSLAELYVQSGEVDRAVALLEQLGGSPADRLEVLERVAKFQQYAQRLDGYQRALEGISRLRPSEDTFRELANLYRYSNQDANLMAALQALIARYPDNPPDYLELAGLLAVSGRKAEAAGVMQQFEKQQPGAVTADSVELLISLELDSGQTGRALDRAVTWLQQHPDAAHIVRLAGLFSARRQPALAARLLVPYERTIDGSPPLLAEWAQLKMANGLPNEAFTRLERLWRQKHLPAELLEPMIGLALDRDRLPLAMEVAGAAGFQHLSGPLLANLAERALAAGQSAFVHRMIVAAGEGFLAGRPVLAARVARERANPASAGQWLRIAFENPKTSDADRLAAAALHRSMGQDAEALAELNRMRLEPAPEPLLLETARMYVELGRPQEALQRIERIPAGSTPRENAAWALAAAAAGRGQEVARWLAGAARGPLPDSLLRDLYFAAQNRNETGLMLDCARRMFAEDSADPNRMRLVHALVAAGRAAEAVPHARLLLARSHAPEVEDEYGSALLAAIRTAPASTADSLRVELRGFWTAKLARPGQDAARRLDLIYGLLDLEAWDTVLPQLGALAAARPALAPLYVETAMKADRRKDAIVFLKSELDNPKLPAEARDAAIYALAEYGGPAEALPYLRRVALAASASTSAISAYQDALLKLERRDELADFLQHRAERDDLSAAERRAIAFQLLDAGRRGAAIRIFRNLARTAKPDDQDVAELLFLWGPKPGPETTSWLEARASHASEAERPLWLRHLLEAGAASAVARIVSANMPPPGRDGPLLDVYLRALAELHDNGRLEESFAREARALADPARLRALAGLARDAGASRSAELLYQKLLSASPADPEARHWLGTWEFGQARYSAAERHLTGLLRESAGGYDDNFYYAELLWRKDDRAAAREYYGRALRAVERIPDPPLDARVIHAQARFRLGSVDASLRELRELLNANPGNTGLRADLAALLLESGRYGEAGDVLFAAGTPAAGRIALLRSQLLSRLDRKSDAFEALVGLAAAEPESPLASMSLGVLEQSIGRSRQARYLLDQAQQLAPDNEDIRQARADLERELAPEAHAEYEHRDIQGTQSENLARFSGNALLSQGYRLALDIDRDQASVQSLMYADGRTGGFTGALARGQLSIVHEWRSGTRVKGSLFSDGASAGGGAEITRPDAGGASTIRIELHRPYWEMPEALAEGGTRDRAEIRRDAALSSRLALRLGASLNRYSLRGARHAAESVGTEGAFAVHLLRRPQVDFEYYLDAEYRLHVVAREDGRGARFQPLPLRSREVHAASFGFAQPVARRLQVSGSSGMAADRFGGQAPFLNLNLSYHPAGHFTARFDFDRRLYVLDTTRSVTTIGGGLYWRF